MKFQSDIAGTVTGVRFYKGVGNTGTHTGNLWTADGTLLSSVVFTNETASGWQEMSFAGPVVIAADTTYVVSYYAPDGHYAADGELLRGIRCRQRASARVWPIPSRRTACSTTARSGFPTQFVQREQLLGRRGVRHRRGRQHAAHGRIDRARGERGRGRAERRGVGDVQ